MSHKVMIELGTVKMNQLSPLLCASAVTPTAILSVYKQPNISEGTDSRIDLQWIELCWAIGSCPRLNCESVS